MVMELFMAENMGGRDAFGVPKLNLPVNSEG